MEKGARSDRSISNSKSGNGSKTLRNSCRLEEVQMLSSFLRMTRMSTSVKDHMTDDLEFKPEGGGRSEGLGGVVDGEGC